MDQGKRLIRRLLRAGLAMQIRAKRTGKKTKKYDRDHLQYAKAVESAMQYLEKE